MDDFSLTTTSTSAKKNCRILKKEAESLFSMAKNHSIEFDIGKTELIHFSNKRKLIEESIEFSKNFIARPKNLVRWLGIFLDSKLLFKEHVDKKITSAEKIFLLIKRLGNTQRGLSTLALRQLYISCITSIADYGVPIWWGERKKTLLGKYQGLQNRALRLILGAFRTSPYRAMELEAAIIPTQLRFEKLCDFYSYRTLKNNNLGSDLFFRK